MRRFLAATVFVPLVSSCTGTDDEAVVQVKDQDLVIAGSRLWSIIDDFPLQICFEGGNSADIATVRDAVESTWEAVPGTAIDFEGWVACQDFGSYDFRVLLDPNREIGVSALGTDLRIPKPNDSHNMKLPLAQTVGTSKARQIAIHEFGHALGINHEMMHIDYVPCDDNNGDPIPKQPREGDTVDLTDLDELGIMNYCNNEATETHPVLTDREELFAQMIYPDINVLSLEIACRSKCFKGSELFLRQDGIAQDEFTARGAHAWYELTGPYAFYWSVVGVPDSPGLGNYMLGQLLEPGTYDVDYSSDVNIAGVDPDPQGARWVSGHGVVNVSNKKWTAIAMSAL